MELADFFFAGSVFDRTTPILRIRRDGGGGSAAKSKIAAIKSKMTIFSRTLGYKEHVCQITAESVDVYYGYHQASQNHS